MKAGILGLIIVFSSICIALFIIAKKNPSPKPTSEIKNILPAQVKSYVNPKYQLNFSYPTNFSVSENDEKTRVSILVKKDSTFIVQVVASTSAFIKKTPLQYILDICRGNKSTIKCSLDSQSVITSNSGASGNSYYLKKTQLVLKNVVGPFVTFPLPSIPPYNSGFIIFYPENLVLSDENKQDFIMIINTVTLPQVHSSISPTGSSSAK